MAKQAELTGMEGNRKLQDLHDAAEEYVEIRDKRMKLTPEEVEAKAKVLAFMHHHKKQNYKFKSEFTGLSLKHCSSWIRELCACGCVIKKGNAPRRVSWGAQLYWYEPDKCSS